MTRKDLRLRVERLLQDSDNRRWDDLEINGYLDDAQLEFCRMAKVPRTSTSQVLVTVGTRRTSCTSSISSKTATITLNGSDTHSLAVGDSVLISGSSNNNINGGQVVTSVPNNQSFAFLLDQAGAGTGSGITIVETGPLFTKASTVLEMDSISIDGRELALHTESKMNYASNRNISSNYYLNTTLGATPAPFFNVNNYYDVPKWRELEGQPEAAIFSERSASTFRIFPLPSLEEHVYVDKDAGTKVSKTILVDGVEKPVSLSADTSTPIIPEYYHEAMVYGALERAYLKESQMRNMDKANSYRFKFLELVNEALRNEALNSMSIGRGRNLGSHMVWR